jgi:ribosomal protein S18 acetylase RimI-like enzyme
VLAESSELVGSVLVRQEGAGTSHIGMFAVRPALQGSGVGRQLLAEAERVARAEQDALRIKMTVIEQRRELIAWYERRGYRETGATEPFPYGNPRFGLPKRGDLRFSVLEKRLS